jgi:ribonucleoside-diphosphate reductase alpha chain
VYDTLILEKYTEDEIDGLNDIIKHERDFDFSYAGLQQCVDKYLIKNRSTGKTYETPQYMYMLIAMVLFSDYEGSRRLEYVRKFYNATSTWKINLPTPIMCGVRSPLRQYSSCVLVDVDDSMDSIFNTNTAVAKYTAMRAGIGINFGRVRAINSQIRNGEVVHTGVVPFLKVYESTAKSCTQNGVRGGGGTVYFPFWHYEIEDIIVLKNNKGTEDNRVRKLDYNIQLCRLFYRRVIEKKDITLFSPHDVPDLYDAFGYDNDKFEELYEKYEKKKGIRKKKINAMELMVDICKERIETGRLYLMNIDDANDHSAFLDPIRMSNLCTEITIPTTPLNHIDDEDAEIGVCVLSAMNVGEIKRIEEYKNLCDLTVRALDYVIENQTYPVKAAENSSKKRRNIGIGITNLARFLAKHKVLYSDPRSLELVDRTMEYIQYYCIKASVELAKEFGACEKFDRTKYSKGILPIDTYCKNVDKLVSREWELDWEELRAEVLEYGMRNSQLTAIMPCESSSVTSNSTNGMEPPRQLISIKKSKQGLLKQVVPGAQYYGQYYTLAFGMVNNKGYLNIAAVIQKWIDQAISVNNYYDFTRYEDGNLPLSEVIDDIMYAKKYGIKCLYYANSNDGKTDETEEEQGCAGGACSV